MNGTAVVIVVKTSKVFNVLGHKHVLNWTLSQIKDVRGVTQIVCVTHPRLLEQTRELLTDEEDLTIISAPVEALKNDVSLEKWLCSNTGPCAGASVVAMCTPTSPFLPASKIEMCIDLVRRKHADMAYTGREVQARTAQGKITGTMELPGCVVFAVSTIGTAPRRFKSVEVSVTESLDITDVSNFRLATLMAERQMV
jgi:hypothetical protein